MSKPPNTLEKWYMDKVTSLGCIICGNQASCHHINSGKNRMGHLFTLPLCWHIHHEGQELSVGNDKKGFISAFGNELWLLVNVLRPKLLEAFPDDVIKLEKIFLKQDERIYFGKIKYILIPPEAHQ